MRDYLLRGGFFMADDFHGTQEQAYFEKNDEDGFPRPAYRGYPERRSHFSHRFRSG